MRGNEKGKGGWLELGLGLGLELAPSFRGNKAETYFSNDESTVYQSTTVAM